MNDRNNQNIDTKHDVKQSKSSQNKQDYSIANVDKKRTSELIKLKSQQAIYKTKLRVLNK